MDRQHLKIIAHNTFLRKKAEEKLKKQKPKTNKMVSETDMLKLIHELEVHQIELEMQNEELVVAKEDAEHSEKKYTDLYNFAPSGYLSLTPEGEISELNFMAGRMLGKERSFLMNQKFGLFISPNFREQFNQFLNDVFSKQEKQTCNLTLVAEGNAPLQVNVDGIMSQNHNHGLLTLTDITERMQFELDLTEAKVAAEQATKLSEIAQKKAESATQIAEEAVKAKQQFLSNMSHEIRTPMNAIIGFTKVLQKTNLSIKQKDYLAAIKMGGDTLIVLINDILDLAKVEAGNITFKQTPFKMANYLSTMLHLFEPKIQEKNLRLIKDYDETIPEVLIGDPERLHQIILNLVGNAVKFTNEGEIVVRVHLLNENDDSVTIQFDVADTGIGIPADKIDLIFENFQQAHTTTSKFYGGTGLGLAIAKKLIESQGGTIRVESKMNEGTTFSFNLNFQKTNADVEYKTDTVQLDSDITGLNILVVEDTYINQILMETILEDFGFTCDIAADGKAAIEKLQANTYNLILMDLQMPEMNGFEATGYIRNTMNLNIPIIALTADVTTAGIEKCIGAGMNDYISKPVDEKILYNKIAQFAKKTFTNKATTTSQKSESHSTKYIDLNYLEKRTKSNPKLLMKMIAIYLEQTPLLVNTMKQGLHDRDWEMLHSSVHKMIPSFSIMGISSNYENMAKKVQEYASIQLASSTINELVFQLETIFLQASKELEAEYKILKNTVNN